MSAEFATQRKWQFGVLPFTGTGHLNPLIALSRQLQAAGHRVTFFEKPKIEDRVRQAGLDFFPIGAPTSPAKKNPVIGRSGLWSDISTLRFNLNRVVRDLEMYLCETPPALAHAGVNALIINEIALTGPTVAQIARLPYFILSTSVPHNFGWAVAPWFAPLRYSTSWFSPVENAYLQVSALRMRGPLRRALDNHRRRAGLGSVSEMQKVFPALAQITPLPRGLDLSRPKLPDNFYYTGPFVSQAARPAVEFPWQRLDGRPLAYAALGTTRNVQPAIFGMIAEACDDLNLQLVISLGGRLDPEGLGELSGNPVVVRYAPQLELLKAARIVITHAGSNTVFEALMEGKPMLAIPIAHDQPAIAARLERRNIAEVLPAKRVSAKRIRFAMNKLLNDPRYREAAARMQAELRSGRGLERAVEIIEEGLERHYASSPMAR